MALGIQPGAGRGWLPTNGNLCVYALLCDSGDCRPRLNTPHVPVGHRNVHAVARDQPGLLTRCRLASLAHKRAPESGVHERLECT